MKEQCSIMFDEVDAGFVEVLFLRTTESIDCEWDAAEWVYDADGEPNWIGDLHRALNEKEFAFLVVPCVLNSGTLKVIANAWVEPLNSGRFFIAITPGEPVWSDVVCQWIQSLLRNSPLLDHKMVDGVRCRIGTEVSRPHEQGGSLMATVAYSLEQLLAAYLEWRPRAIVMYGQPESTSD